nr:transposase [Paenibacillus sp. 1_12]
MRIILIIRIIVFVVEGSNVSRDITCKLGTEQCRSQKRHRVVFFQDDHGNEIRVATKLLHVSAEQIAAIYKARWGIEVFFRWIKQHLNVPILFGTTENAVYGQLFAALLAFVLLQWLHSSTKPSIIKCKNYSHEYLSSVCSYWASYLPNGRSPFPCFSISAIKKQ